MGIGTLERTSQDWAAMFGHYGEVASIDLHLRRKFRKAKFFWREGGVRSEKYLFYEIQLSSLFVCLFCFVRVDFFSGFDPMVKSPRKKHHLFRREGEECKNHVGHDLEGCKPEAKRLRRSITCCLNQVDGICRILYLLNEERFRTPSILKITG